jgi:tRNA A37 N6-isopentenylltransferase MiaA
MAELTIKQAAQLYGLHHSSIYQAIDEGRVSSRRNARNHRVIDMAELIRVWGEPPSTRIPESANPNASVRAGSRTRMTLPDDFAELLAAAVADAVAKAIAPLIERLEAAELKRIEHKPPVETPANDFADIFESIKSRTMQ